MKKPTVSLVLGGSHSIGVPLAVASDCSFIVPSASMTIHPVRMNGLILGVPQTLDYFLRMQERITDFVVTHSSIKKERFLSLMMNTCELAADIGSVLDGPDAVKEGLIDHLGGLKEALACLYQLIEKEKTS
jgi:ATP-dependent protease ClpP protease subunit